MKSKPTVVPLARAVDPTFAKLCGLAWDASRDTEAVTLTTTFGEGRDIRSVTISVSQLDPE